MDTAGVILGLERIFPPVFAPLCERLDSPTPLLLRLATHTSTHVHTGVFAHLLSDPRSVNGLVRPDDV